MKRCPTCNRVETDEALRFCRADGVMLIDESSAIDSEAGTVQLGSQPNQSELHTNILAHRIQADVNRTTGPTTVLSPRPEASTTSELGTSNKRKTTILVAVIVTVIVTVLVGATSAFFVNAYRSRKSTSTAIQSIAVMPFVNQTGNTDVEYLSDGMTETLINSLSQLPELTVKARSSVFRYKGKEVDPQAVGNELKVQALLNGRVIRIGDNLTLYLSLVDTRTGNQLWGDQYSRKSSDLLSLQNEVSRDVATKLRTRLTGSEAAKVSKNYTQNIEAYQLYLQGRFFANKRTPQSIQKAIAYYQQAIEKDPTYALGYAGLSDAYGLLAYYEGGPAPESLRKAREAALRALSLDDNLAEAHNAMGFVLTVADFDYAAGEREYKRAIELNPNYTSAHHNLGVMLVRTGREAEGMAELRRALEIEPFSTVVNRLYGEVLGYSRHYEEGLAQLKKTVELDPSFPTTYFALSNLYRMMGKYSESVESFAKFQELYGRPETAALARSSFAVGGWPGYVREMTTKRPAGLTPYVTATYFTYLGDKDKAFDELNKAFENQEYSLRFIKLDSSLDPLRDDPRFKDLLRRLRFPE